LKRETGSAGLLYEDPVGVPLHLRRGSIRIETRGQGFTDITSALRDWLSGAGAEEGLLTLFIRHTSASLTVQENADPDVLADLQEALGRFAPESGSYRHRMEGPDDMPAHIKTLVTSVSLSIPVTKGKPAFGTWQAAYLIEHRRAPHRRDISLIFVGTTKI